MTRFRGCVCGRQKGKGADRPGTAEDRPIRRLWQDGGWIILSTGWRQEGRGARRCHQTDPLLSAAGTETFHLQTGERQDPSHVDGLTSGRNPLRLPLRQPLRPDTPIDDRRKVCRRRLHMGRLRPGLRTIPDRSREPKGSHGKIHFRQPGKRLLTFKT